MATACSTDFPFMVSLSLALPIPVFLLPHSYNPLHPYMNKFRFVFVRFEVDICANLIQIEPLKWSTQSCGGSGRRVMKIVQIITSS
jgi:hypothetical protein